MVGGEQCVCCFACKFTRACTRASIPTGHPRWSHVTGHLSERYVGQQQQRDINTCIHTHAGDVLRDTCLRDTSAAAATFAATQVSSCASKSSTRCASRSASPGSKSCISQSIIHIFIVHVSICVRGLLNDNDTVSIQPCLDTSQTLHTYKQIAKEHSIVNTIT